MWLVFFENNSMRVSITDLLSKSTAEDELR